MKMKAFYVLGYNELLLQTSSNLTKWQGTTSSSLPQPGLQNTESGLEKSLPR